jgi:hypothetical protein
MSENDKNVNDAVKSDAKTNNALGMKQEQVDLLLRILLAKEAKAASEENDKAEAEKQKHIQRLKNAAGRFKKLLIKQARCTHLKGGKHRRNTQAKDYAVYYHTYINSVPAIRCFVCRMTWYLKDTKEFLFRNDKKVPNHTKLGWNEAREMLGTSTNTPSCSEIPFGTRQGAGMTTQDDFDKIVEAY